MANEPWKWLKLARTNKAQFTLKITLTAITTALLVSLIANICLYNEQQKYPVTNAALREEAAELSILKNTLERETAELKNRLNQLNQQGPKLATRLGASDLRFNYTGQETRFYVSGEVWNVGTSTARNSKLHVTLYQNNTVAKETYIELGNIEPGTYVDVASNVYYTGNALTNWTLTPENE